MDKPISGGGIAVGVTLGIIAFIACILLFSSCATVKQDEVGFAVGGGLVDSQKGKVKGDLIEPGSPGRCR